MGEQKIIERPLMKEEEFKKYIEETKVDVVKAFYEEGILYLRTYGAVNKFRSIRRAIRRGHVSIDGFLFPKRPFNNRANTCKRKSRHSRSFNEKKKIIYEQLKYRKSA